jgi:hypothetical protein
MAKSIGRGLLVKSPHIDRILARRKTWEIRGTRTSVRELIALIRIGSGQIVGTCEIVDVLGPLTCRLQAERTESGTRVGKHHTTTLCENIRMGIEECKGAEDAAHL